MKIESPLFDRIRVKPEADRMRRTACPACQWPGCASEGAYKAPKGRHAEGQYWHYCLAHVREYNQSYNYFSGMTDDALHAYQKDALTGHRPTWRMGMRGAAPAGGPAGGAGAFRDPFGFAEEFGGAEAFTQQEERRPVRTLERQALETLNLEVSATKDEIKARFKELVKRHHPDANGGDRSAEDRLRNIIQAYNSLKQAGYC